MYLFFNCKASEWSHQTQTQDKLNSTLAMMSLNLKFRVSPKFNRMNRWISSLKKFTGHLESTSGFGISMKSSMKTRFLNNSDEICKVMIKKTNKLWQITKRKKLRRCPQSPWKIVSSDILPKNRRQKSNHISININSISMRKNKLMPSNKKRTYSCYSSYSWTEYLSFEKNLSQLPTTWPPMREKLYQRNLTFTNGSSL